MAVNDPAPAAPVEPHLQSVALPAQATETPEGGGHPEPCWQRVSQELTRRKDSIPSLSRRRDLHGKVIARFAIAADGRAHALQFDEAGVPLAQDIVRGLLREPFSEACAGEGRWVVQFVPR
ncbi:MAG: hypothetical protein HYZ27_08955 [Deltaproteobacteria bacterium]|nr:hypothetical protein [Deltaproteobacteria bacterium]